VTGDVISQGEGTVDGNHVDIGYPNARRPVTMDLHISLDSEWLLGKVTRFDGTRARCGDTSDRLVQNQAEVGRQEALNPDICFRLTFYEGSRGHAERSADL